MKRNFLIFILILSAVLCAYGQNSPIDLVLLLDTSSGMSSSYDNVNNYITGPFLNEFLRVGDTFHLITFSANQRLDCARHILGIGDIETIIGRMLIQYPIENGNNVTAALTFAERYVSPLPSRAKKIVLITTSGADTNNLVNASKQRLNSRNTTLDYVQVTPGQPLSNLPKSGRPAAKTTTAAAVNKPSTTAAENKSSPSQTTATSKTPSSTDKTSGSGTETSGTSTASGTSTVSGTSAASGTSNVSGTNTASGTGAASGANTVSGTGTASETNKNTTSPTGSGTGAAAVTDTSSSAETNSNATGQAALNKEDTNASKQSTAASGADDFYVSKSDDSSNYVSKASNKEKKSIAFSASLPLILLIVFIVLLILGLIIFLASRRLGSSPNRVMAEASSSRPKDISKFEDHSKDLASYAAGQSRRTTPYEDRPVKLEKNKQPVINPSGPLLLNFVVDDQNTLIGKRNIHSLKSGYNLSIGGGKADDYLIFLVPMPAHIGEIRRNGSSLSFVPKKSKYFPEIGSNEVKDCINKTIRVISEKNYEMRFRFEMYEDPLESLNRMLMSVKVPG